MPLWEIDELRRLAESLDLKQVTYEAEEQFLKPKQKSGLDDSEKLRIELDRRKKEDAFLNG